MEFSETVKLPIELFGANMSLWHKRWLCMNVSKSDDQDYLTYASIVNRHCDNFRLAEITVEEFKCLIFAQGLVSSKSAEIRRRVLSKLESEQNLTLQKLAEECERAVSLKKVSQKSKKLALLILKK